MIPALLIACAVVSVLLTGALRRYARARSLLDIPNDRSSHTVPTPRGGGVAIVVTFLAGVAVLAAWGSVSPASAIALEGAGVAVAVVGFLDDHGHIAARWRLLAHFCAAAWALAWLGGLPPVPFGGAPVDLGWAGHFLAAVYLVWMLNLYNFMDGIDGIAGLEAVTACLGAAALYLCFASSSQNWVLPALLALAALGFLVWNWPPAKIFMGDAGSGFLGITLGVLSLQAAWMHADLLWGWVILLGVFIVDATVTLLRRLRRGEKPYEAHRTHAYQNASRRYGSHGQVTLAAGAINLFWLLPLAFAVTLGWISGVIGVIVAYVPLVVLALWFRAGVPAA